MTPHLLFAPRNTAPLGNAQILLYTMLMYMGLKRNGLVGFWDRVRRLRKSSKKLNQEDSDTERQVTKQSKTERKRLNVLNWWHAG